MVIIQMLCSARREENRAPALWPCNLLVIASYAENGGANSDGGWGWLGIIKICSTQRQTQSNPLAFIFHARH